MNPFSRSRVSPRNRREHCRPNLEALEGRLLLSITEYPVPTPGAWPTGITFRRDGVWFAEYYGKKLGQVNTQDGSITEHPVSANASFIALGPDTNLWFTEETVNRVARFNHDYSETDYPVSGSPRAVTAGPDGNIWFTEWDTNKIGRISLPDGGLTEFPITPNSYPFGITKGPDGNIWFAESGGYPDTGHNGIGRITPDGVITEYPIAGPKGPLWITTGPDGNLWFTEFYGGNIGRISTTGDVTEFSVPDASKNGDLHTICAGPDGNLWFTYQQSSKIGQITLTGIVTSWTTPTPNSVPVGITRGLDGNIWFTEMVADKIGEFNLGSAPSGNNPTGVALPNPVAAGGPASVAEANRLFGSHMPVSTTASTGSHPPVDTYFESLVSDNAAAPTLHVHRAPKSLDRVDDSLLADAGLALN